MPVRIQRKRTKGWRMPEGAVYVGRPTRWGNPVSSTADFKGRLYASVAFRQLATERAAVDPKWLAPLRGKDLACWCPLSQPCHADVLLELANAARAGED